MPPVLGSLPDWRRWMCGESPQLETGSTMLGSLQLRHFIGEAVHVDSFWESLPGAWNQRGRSVRLWPTVHITTLVMLVLYLMCSVSTLVLLRLLSETKVIAYTHKITKCNQCDYNL